MIKTFKERKDKANETQRRIGTPLKRTRKRNVKTVRRAGESEEVKAG
jgi:hypothetical protein